MNASMFCYHVDEKPQVFVKCYEKQETERCEWTGGIGWKSNIKVTWHNKPYNKNRNIKVF